MKKRKDLKDGSLHWLQYLIEPPQVLDSAGCWGQWDKRQIPCLSKEHSRGGEMRWQTNNHHKIPRKQWQCPPGGGHRIAGSSGCSLKFTGGFRQKERGQKCIPRKETAWEKTRRWCKRVWELWLCPEGKGMRKCAGTSRRPNHGRCISPWLPFSRN